MRLPARRQIATAFCLATAFGLAAPAARAGDPPPEATEEPAPPPTPELVLRGFGDVNYRWMDGTPKQDSFELGQVDLFVTSRLSDDLSVLGEIVFQPRGGDTFTAHVERLLLTYHPTDALRLSAGRYHTAIGYYNTAFHHGTWFQTAVDRPFLFAFAKDGGILPIHNVGLSAGGRLPFEGVGLHYVTEVGDAQPFHTSTGEVDPAAGDDSLAVNLGLYARPPSVAGLQVGVSAYYDRRDHASGDAANRAGRARLGELITAAYVVYESSAVELLNEVLAIRHRTSGQPSTQSWGFYAQAAPKRGWWRPYVRYQYFRADAGDHLLAALGRSYGPSLGLRRELGSFAALKLQYDRTTRKGLGSRNGLTVQAAFTF
jgi:hypothetical protein